MGMDTSDLVIEPLQNDGSQGIDFGGLTFSRTISGMGSVTITTEQVPLKLMNQAYRDLIDEGYAGIAIQGNITEKEVYLNELDSAGDFLATQAVFQPDDLDYLDGGTDTIFDETVMLHGMATREFASLWDDNDFVGKSNFNDEVVVNVDEGGILSLFDGTFMHRVSAMAADLERDLTAPGTSSIFRHGSLLVQFGKDTSLSNALRTVTFDAAFKHVPMVIPVCIHYFRWFSHSQG